MAKYYLDTSIWIDYYENRSDRFRPLGEWAFRFIKKTVSNQDQIIISDLLIAELKKRYSAETIQQIFEIVDLHLLIHIEVSSRQDNEAIHINNQRGVGYADSLHAILARDNGAILITRDKHFAELNDIVLSKKPEELL